MRKIKKIRKAKKPSKLTLLRRQLVAHKHTVAIAERTIGEQIGQITQLRSDLRSTTDHRDRLENHRKLSFDITKQLRETVDSTMARNMVLKSEVEKLTGDLNVKTQECGQLQSQLKTWEQFRVTQRHSWHALEENLGEKGPTLVSGIDWTEKVLTNRRGAVEGACYGAGVVPLKEEKTCRGGGKAHLTPEVYHALSMQAQREVDVAILKYHKGETAKNFGPETSADNPAPPKPITWNRPPEPVTGTYPPGSWILEDDRWMWVPENDLWRYR